MATELNVVSISGRATQDAELRYTAGGTGVLRIPLANNKSYKKDNDWKSETCYLEAVVWGEYGIALSEKIKKGMMLNVSGRLKQERWETESGEKRSKHVLTADSVQIISSVAAASVASGETPDNPFSDDEIPW